MPYLFDWNDESIEPHKLAEYHRVLRAVPTGRNMEAACELTELQHDVIAAGVRVLYPELSEREVRLKVGAFWVPDELLAKAHAWQQRKTDEENQCQEDHS